jgi:hypothetical protein
MIKIFQINANRDKHNVIFMGYKWLKEFDFSIYDEVWSGAAPYGFDSLDEIFTTFNIDHPEDFYGHSLSVSDIVQIIESDTEESGYYFCDNYGWKKLDL